MKVLVMSRVIKVTRGFEGAIIRIAYRIAYTNAVGWGPSPPSPHPEEYILSNLSEGAHQNMAKEIAFPKKKQTAESDVKPILALVLLVLCGN